LSEDLGELTVKDRLNFPYLLANQILTFQQSLIVEGDTEYRSQEALKGLVNMIPVAWKDPQFHEELEKAVKKVKIDNRPVVVKGIRMNEETCKKLGVKPYTIEKEVDYYKLFQACMNLLNRRGLLSKLHRIEVLEGVDFDTVEIPPPLER
jgi:hypothetical protein